MKNYKILLIAPVTSFGGYAANGRFWADAFKSLGHDVKIGNFNDYRTGYELSTHQEWYNQASYDPVGEWEPDFVFNSSNPVGYQNSVYPQICSTAWETDRLPTKMGETLKTQKVVTIQSSFNLPAFKKWHDNVQVVPLGVNTDVFKPNPQTDDVFTFVTNGKWEYRKNFTNLIKVFRETFENNKKVRLLIKSHPFTMNATEIFQHIAFTNENKSAIYVNLSDLKEQGIAEIYNKSHVFVLPTRGEGFGVPFLEAMSCGIPTIAPEIGGHTDFVTKTNSLLIKSKLVDNIYPMGSYEPGMKFIEPDLKSLRNQLIYAVDNPGEMTKLGQQARKDAEKLSLNNVALKMQKLLEEEIK